MPRRRRDPVSDLPARLQAVIDADRQLRETEAAHEQARESYEWADDGHTDTSTENSTDKSAIIRSLVSQDISPELAHQPTQKPTGNRSAADQMADVPPPSIAPLRLSSVGRGAFSCSMLRARVSGTVSSTEPCRPLLAEMSVKWRPPSVER